MFGWYKKLRAKRHERKFRAAVRFIEKTRPDLFQAFLLERATDLAANIMMREWDKEGVRHCSQCPSRQQLRVFKDRFYCPDHKLLAETLASKELAVVDG